MTQLAPNWKKIEFATLPKLKWLLATHDSKSAPDPKRTSAKLAELATPRAVVRRLTVQNQPQDLFPSMDDDVRRNWLEMIEIDPEDILLLPMRQRLTIAENIREADNALPRTDHLDVSALEALERSPLAIPPTFNGKSVYFCGRILTHKWDPILMAVPLIRQMGGATKRDIWLLSQYPRRESYMACLQR